MMISGSARYVQFRVVLPDFVPLVTSQKIVREQNPAPTPETCFINPGSCLEPAMLTPKCALDAMRVPCKLPHQEEVGHGCSQNRDDYQIGGGSTWGRG